MVMTKNLLGPMVGEGSGRISSEPKVIAIDFAPALISFRGIARLERSEGEGGSVADNPSSVYPSSQALAEHIENTFLRSP
jgi:hypothetical protein